MSRVSVMLPTFHTKEHPRLQWLPAAVESVLSQSLGDLELIICDNGGDPEMIAYLLGIEDPRVRITRIAQNDLVKASIALRQYASAPLVCWMTDDDVMLPGWLEAGAAFMDVRPDVGVCWGGSGKGYREVPFDVIFARHQCPFPCTLFRRQFLPIWDQFSRYLTGDWMAWIEMAYLTKLVEIPHPMVSVRLHSDSHTEREGYGQGKFIPEHMAMMRSWLERGHRPSHADWNTIAAEMQWKINYTRAFTQGERDEYMALFNELRHRYE